MRPDEEWVCSRNPASERSAITLRIEAGLKPSRLDRASVREPTGSPVEMKVSTMAVRISRSRFPILGSAGIDILVRSLYPSGGSRGRNRFRFILPNYFRCRRLGFGPKLRSCSDSRNGVERCQPSERLERGKPLTAEVAERGREGRREKKVTIPLLCGFSWDLGG